VLVDHHTKDLLLVMTRDQMEPGKKRCGGCYVSSTSWKLDRVVRLPSAGVAG
jgi:hypothetical protein